MPLTVAKNKGLVHKSRQGSLVGVVSGFRCGRRSRNRGLTSDRDLERSLFQNLHNFSATHQAP